MLYIRDSCDRAQNDVIPARRKVVTAMREDGQGQLGIKCHGISRCTTSYRCTWWSKLTSLHLRPMWTGVCHPFCSLNSVHVWLVGHRGGCLLVSFCLPLHRIKCVSNGCGLFNKRHTLLIEFFRVCRFARLFVISELSECLFKNRHSRVARKH